MRKYKVSPLLVNCILGHYPRHQQTFNTKVIAGKVAGKQTNKIVTSQWFNKIYFSGPLLQLPIKNVMSMSYWF